MRLEYYICTPLQLKKKGCSLQSKMCTFEKSAAACTQYIIIIIFIIIIISSSSSSIVVVVPLSSCSSIGNSTVYCGIWD